MCQSKERDFTTVADSTARHLSLSRLVFSCCATYQLESTTKFLPHLLGCQQSLVMVSPLPPSFSSPGTVLCGGGQICWPHSIQGVATVFSPVLSITLSFYPIIFQHKQCSWILWLSVLLRADIYPGLTSGRRDVFVCGNDIEFAVN